MLSLKNFKINGTAMRGQLKWGGSLGDMFFDYYILCMRALKLRDLSAEEKRRLSSFCAVLSYAAAKTGMGPYIPTGEEESPEALLEAIKAHIEGVRV